jgi:very-short-patch-repair endonuclease
MARPPLGQLFAFADRRFGVFTAADARRFGVTERMLHYRSSQHVVERLHRGVYRVVGAHDDWHQRVMAAIAACGPRAVASHRTAAALHRFDGFDPAQIDIAVPPAVLRTASDAAVRRLALPSVDVCKVGVIPATTPLRTIIDLGVVVDEDLLVRALDAAERDGKVQRRLLLRRLAELGPRTGTATLRRVLARREAVGHTPRSVLERAMLDLLERHSLPVPICQYRVERLDGRAAYLDFAYPDVRLAIEVDGKGHATLVHRAADATRTNALPGWRVLRFAFDDVMGRPGHVAAVVGAQLRS